MDCLNKSQSKASLCDDIEILLCGDFDIDLNKDLLIGETPLKNLIWRKWYRHLLE